MSQTLPPVRTAGNVSDVGSAVAAAFGHRDAAQPHQARPAPSRPARVVEADDEAEWDPTEVAGARRPDPAPRANVSLTLGQVWEAQSAQGDDDADWDPRDVRRIVQEDATPSTISGASMAALAISRMFGSGR